MTTEEQLKIYAAYLPYNVAFSDLTCDMPNKLILGTENFYGVLEDAIHLNTIRLHLWDLSYLTKEIEHEGERFVPIQKLRKHCIEELGAKDYDTDIGIDKLVKGWELIYWPKLFIDKLLEWHFNIFGIPAGEFIPKTLKTESYDHR